jgi:hypothetical protein
MDGKLHLIEMTMGQRLAKKMCTATPYSSRSS